MVRGLQTTYLELDNTNDLPQFLYMQMHALSNGLDNTLTSDEYPDGKAIRQHSRTSRAIVNVQILPIPVHQLELWNTDLCNVYTLSIQLSLLAQKLP
ncbi:hypothetical protein KCU85_g1599, partial [Aureobasidium melanogenum]